MANLAHPQRAGEKGNPGVLKLPKLAMDDHQGAATPCDQPLRVCWSHRWPARRPCRPPRRSEGGRWRRRLDLARSATHRARRDGAKACRPRLPSACSDMRAALSGNLRPAQYPDEMAAALATLAALIKQIVGGEPGSNVVPLHAR